MAPMPPQLDFDANHWPIDIDAVVPYSPVRLAIAFGQIKIRNMHEIQTCRHCVAGTEVISHSTTYVDSKGNILSLRILDPLGPLSVDSPHAKAYVKVGHNPPIT